MKSMNLNGLPQTVLEAIKTGQTPENSANNEDDEPIYDPEMFLSDDSADEENLKLTSIFKLPIFFIIIINE
ncbi:unnamed protein product [Acanthoscelides obtectus]|uniref:Uncharacterized protein n=1 Tax=Acanthoscelides obtectus TaxID=200917 RepID=A0A9P0MM90_ACAOB|nr:unnamed protein product [Acanthoscelides obtectus]CAK1682751.1 hypothetical protein AOBTE_LOCUS33851 [Acanthoscelides obtectus]